MKNNLKSAGQLERARKKFLFLGLITVCSMTLVAFKVSSYDFEKTKTSSIYVPEDEATIFFELPEQSFTQQKQAAKTVVISIESYNIVEEVGDEIFTDLPLDITNLDNSEVGTGEDFWGEDDPEDTIIESQIPIDWTRLSRTPYFDDCEDVMDRKAESNCTYEQIRILVQQECDFPSSCREIGLSGKVWVTFVIDKKGKVKDVKALNDNVHADFIAEAERAVKALPQMNPGTQKLRPVNVKLTIPVSFNLR